MPPDRFAGTKTRLIAVASGKGGVGKSTVATNLAIALAVGGAEVGLVDADVWGFSIPKMLGLDAPPEADEKGIVPPMAYGVKVISMDFFVGADQAVVWRGPMLHKAVEQFLFEVAWGEPDYLVVDLPPGTGDVSISLSQFAPTTSQIIVTTPQPTAQRVARRAGLMARKVNQQVLGVVENMAWFTCEHGDRHLLFGEGGGRLLADQLEVPLLAQIPLVPALREGADQGVPAMVAAPDSDAAAAFTALAAQVEKSKPRVRSHPKLVIS